VECAKLVRMRILPLAVLLFVSTVYGQLTVTVSPPKGNGERVIIPLALKNDLSKTVESARAVVFLLNDGKMVGQASRWVIGGGKDKPGLPSGGTNTFNFVVTTDRPFTTNLTARVSFLRVILEHGKLADIAKDVQIQPATK